ncbi:MAG: hypothetical protein NUV46_02315, partial [Nanoarchaeota archaeon]|nr:hypothetical protein [Nanoarchaeota archaeon]
CSSYTSVSPCNGDDFHDCTWIDTSVTKSCEVVSQSSCGIGTYSTCSPQYSCDSSVSNFCSDPDEQDIFTKGTTTGYTGYPWSHIDYCDNQTSVKEWFCIGGGNFLGSSNFDCEFGCDYGKCNTENQNPSCTDSDFGINYSVQGTVTSTMGPTGPDYCVTGSVASAGPGVWSDPTLGSDSGSYVVEYSCTPFNSGNMGKQTLNFCSYGCNLGACISQAETCSETDGGNKPLIPGSTTYGGSTLKDRCESSEVQTEYHCSNGVRVSNTDGCQSGTSCVISSSTGEGYCKQNPFCNDTDFGINYNVQGTVNSHVGNLTDYCETDITPGEILREFYCSGTTPLSTTSGCPFGCTNGKCDNEPAFCTDTDAVNNDGDKPYTKGTVNTDNGGVFTDSCYSGTPIGTGQSITGFAVVDTSLTENFCSGTSKVTQNYNCANGCFGGACIASYFGDANGNNYTSIGYLNKNIGDTVYLWTAGIPTISPGGFVEGSFVGNYSLTIKEKDDGAFNSDDTVRTNVRLNVFQPAGYPDNTKYGATWVITQSDIDACTDLGEGDECEFYFELVANGVTYRSPLTSPNLVVPKVAPLPERYWANPFDLSIQWTNKSYGAPFEVALVMLDPEIFPPSFSISGREVISPYGSYNYGSFAGSTSGGDYAYYIWKINESVLGKFTSEGPYKFKFEIQSGESPEFTVDRDTGTCGNGLCESPGENETTCPADCLGQCAGINLCGDYTNSIMCDSDECGVAGATPPPAGPGQTDACGWNSISEPSCRKVLYTTTTNGTSVGSCASTQNSTSQECVGGFLFYSWLSKWTWYPSNNFTSLSLCQAYSSDCAEAGACFDDGSSTTNPWHCDPDRASLACESGSAQIPCPAQIQLSFFDWKNVIVALLLIFVLYIIFYKKNKKFSKNHFSKKKVKRK